MSNKPRYVIEVEFEEGRSSRFYTSNKESLKSSIMKFTSKYSDRVKKVLWYESGLHRDQLSFKEENLRSCDNCQKQEATHPVGEGKLFCFDCVTSTLRG